MISAVVSLVVGKGNKIILTNGDPHIRQHSSQDYSNWNRMYLLLCNLSPTRLPVLNNHLWEQRDSNVLQKSWEVKESELVKAFKLNSNFIQNVSTFQARWFTCPYQASSYLSTGQNITLHLMEYFFVDVRWYNSDVLHSRYHSKTCLRGHNGSVHRKRSSRDLTCS